MRLADEYNADDERIGYDEKLFYLSEGQFKDDELNGFGRKIWGSDHSAIGWYCNAILHGYALQTDSNGMIQEGLFVNEEYVVGDRQMQFNLRNKFDGLYVDWQDYFIHHEDPNDDF